MITSWDIYWITRLDSINNFLCAVWILFIVSVVFSPVALTALDDFGNEIQKVAVIKWWKRYALVSILAAILNTVIPSTKEYAAIYLIPKIANNQQIQKIPDNVPKLLNVKMEEWIEGITKIKDGKKKEVK